MSNNIKRAIKARKQKLSERHSTARSHVLGTGGGSGSGSGSGSGGPPASGLAQCVHCGLGYVADDPEDIRTHEARHVAIDDAARAGIVVEMDYGELESRKSESWKALSAATTNSERLVAMDGVCRCHWERSMSAAIVNGTFKQHPSFETYACAYDVFDRPEYPRGLWRTRHRYRAVPGMKPGTSYWEPAVNDEKRRYYLHGDVREDGTYYCSRCDAFVAVDHTDVHPDERESDANRLAREWNGFYAIQQGKAVAPASSNLKGFQRPSDAANVFQGLEAPTYPFRQFIMTRRPRENPRGDAIEDTQVVMRMDDRVNTVADVRNYMTAHRASQEARVAMGALLREYARTTSAARSEVGDLDRRFGPIDG